MIHAELSRGCHKLIRQGAKLVESAADVFEEFADLALPATAGSPAGRADAPASLQSSAPSDIPDAFGVALAYDPVTFDALCERAGLADEVAYATLMEMELAGTVERLPSNRYRRLA